MAASGSEDFHHQADSRSGITEGLKASGALAFGDFTLASGKKSRFYIDIKKAITNPAVLREIAEAMVPFAAKADKVAGVELGAVPLAAAVSLASGKPYLMVRKATKEHGTKKEFEGELTKGEKVLFVEDVITTGGTLRGAIERMRAQGAVVEDVVAVVDREEGGKIALAEITVRLHALVTAKDLLASA